MQEHRRTAPASVWLIIVVLMGWAALSIGCNTVEGAGEDVEAAGDSIEDAAD